MTTRPAAAGVALLLAAGAWLCSGESWARSWWPHTNADPRSAEIVLDDEQLFATPTRDERRRGAARLGARLPVFGWAAGPDCRSRWLNVGAQAWLCEDDVRLSEWPADAAGKLPWYEDGLPFRYHFVGDEGSFGYATLADADDTVPVTQLEPGFSVGVVRFEPKPGGGESFALTSHGMWLPARDLTPANPSAFEGVVVTDGELDAAWIAGSQAALFDAPNGRRLGHTLAPLTRIAILDEVEDHGRRFTRVADGYVHSQHVRVARPRAAPAGSMPGERWIDIELDSQTLVAYEGDRPVFATLIASGRGTGDSSEATPRGEFRIWVKLLSADMSNLEEDTAGHYYAIEDVPWVMFFQAGYGLHGAFWHRAFGTQRSHGCVNLSPRDAQRLFHWASPRLPSGWRAVRPTRHDQGTRVVVR